MNDFDYDCYQKKQLARNAKHRKGKVLGTKGCRLPHEYLTKKEIEKMNGELYSINLNKPISWERFKTLTPSLQEEYLQHIMDRFGIGLSSISKDMFGMADTSLNTYAIRHNLNLNRGRGRTARAVLDRWHRWLDDPEPTLASAIEKHEVPVIEEPEDQVIEEPEEPVEDVKLFRAHDFTPTPPKALEESGNVNPYPYPATDMNLTLKGSPIDVLTTLRMSFPTLLDSNKEYRFNLIINLCASERRPEHL